MKMMASNLLALGVISAAALWAMPSAYGAGDDGISPGEFEIYQRRQGLALEHEQALHAERSKPRSDKESRRQRRQFEAERTHQRQLLERQRRQVAAERIRLRPGPRPKSYRGIALKRLKRTQASERLSRKLLR